MQRCVSSGRARSPVLPKSALNPPTARNASIRTAMLALQTFLTLLATRWADPGYEAATTQPNSGGNHRGAAPRSQTGRIGPPAPTTSGSRKDGRRCRSQPSRAVASSSRKATRGMTAAARHCGSPRPRPHTCSPPRAPGATPGSRGPAAAGCGPRRRSPRPAPVADRARCPLRQRGGANGARRRSPGRRSRHRSEASRSCTRGVRAVGECCAQIDDRADGTGVRVPPRRARRSRTWRRTGPRRPARQPVPPIGRSPASAGTCVPAGPCAAPGCRR